MKNHIRRAIRKLFGKSYSSGMHRGKDMASQSLVRTTVSPQAGGIGTHVRITNARLQAAIDAALIREINAFLSKNGLQNRSIAHEQLTAYRECYSDNPAREGEGATASNTLLWLYLISYSLNPRLIVESGVHIGRSLWTLRSANPDAVIYAFDITLARLRFRDKSINLVESDWSDSDTRASGPNDFCYFDDHVNNCLRIRQAYDRGFRHLIFDDSPGLASLYHFRYPGIPTAQMIAENYMADGETVSWRWGNQMLEYTYRDGDTHGAHSLVEHIDPLPSLERFTGVSGPQHSTYVRLKRNK